MTAEGVIQQPVAADPGGCIDRWAADQADDRFRCDGGFRLAIALARGWPVNPQGKSTCNVRAEAGPAIGWAWVSAFSCQLGLASSAVVGAVGAAGGAFQL